MIRCDRCGAPTPVVYESISYTAPCESAGCVEAERAALAQSRRDIWRERRERERAGRLDAGGVPGRYRRQLDALQMPDEVRREIEAYVRERSSALVLIGPVGVGKSTIAGALLARAAGSGPVTWLRGDEPANDPFQNRHGQIASGLVVVDDIDVPIANAATVGAIKAVVELTSAGQRLIVTSNHDIREIADRFRSIAGEAIASRLQGGRVVYVDGHDRRVVSA